MINRLSFGTCFILPWLLLVSGCEQQHKKDTSAIAPDIKTTTVPADYATRAIDATGGMQEWIKAEKLEFDCVVTLFEPQGSFYLTEHHYQIHPWSNSIRISADEPLSKFVWQLSNGQFNMLEGNKRNDISPVAGFYRDYAEALLRIITAPAFFLDSKAFFTKVPMTVKIGGLWYQPIQQTIRPPTEKDSAKSAEPYWSKVILYQNVDSSLVDTLWFANFSEKKFFLVRGYDYKKMGKKKVLTPTKIEIFKTNERGAIPHRLAEINFK